VQGSQGVAGFAGAEGVPGQKVTKVIIPPQVVFFLSLVGKVLIFVTKKKKDPDSESIMHSTMNLGCHRSRETS